MFLKFFSFITIFTLFGFSIQPTNAQYDGSYDSGYDGGYNDGSYGDGAYGGTGTDGSYAPSSRFRTTVYCLTTPPRIRLDWTYSGSTKPASAKVFRKTETDPFIQIYQATTEAAIESGSYNDSSVTIGESYTYKLEYYRSNGSLLAGPYFAPTIHGFCATPPGTITMTASPPCILLDGDIGSDFTFNWTNTNSPVTWADISTTDTFTTYYHKAVTGGVVNQPASVTAPSGFNGFLGVSGPLALYGATTYYVRLFNGVNGPTPPFSFNIPVCASTSGPTVNLSLNGKPFTDFPFLTIKQNDPGVTIAWSTVGAVSCTASIPPSSDPPSAALTTAWSGSKALSGSQVLPVISTTGTYQFMLTCTNGINTSATSTLVVTQLQKPYIQTTGGDVHTNETINIPRIP